MHIEVGPHVDMQGTCTCRRIHLSQFTNRLCNGFKGMVFRACACEAKLLHINFQLRFPKKLILRHIERGNESQ